MSDDNVILFPFQGSPPVTLESIRDRVDAIDEVYVESATERVFSMVMEAVMASGFDCSVLDEEATSKDACLVFMALKSMLMKIRGKHHPLQNAAENIIVSDENGYVYIDQEKCDEAWNR